MDVPAGEEVGARWSLIVGGVPTLAVGIVTYPILAQVDRRRSARRAEPDAPGSK